MVEEDYEGWKVLRRLNKIDIQGIEHDLEIGVWIEIFCNSRKQLSSFMANHHYKFQ